MQWDLRGAVWPLKLVPQGVRWRARRGVLGDKIARGTSRWERASQEHSQWDWSTALGPRGGGLGSRLGQLGQEPVGQEVRIPVLRVKEVVGRAVAHVLFFSLCWVSLPWEDPRGSDAARSRSQLGVVTCPSIPKSEGPQWQAFGSLLGSPSWGQFLAGTK